MPLPLYCLPYLLFGISEKNLKMSELASEFTTYLQLKKDLSEKQKDDYVKSMTKKVSQRLLNIIDTVNNS